MQCASLWYQESHDQPILYSESTCWGGNVFKNIRVQGIRVALAGDATVPGLFAIKGTHSSAMILECNTSKNSCGIQSIAKQSA